MPSSTSNSNPAGTFERAVPSGAWPRLALMAALGVVLIAGAWEAVVRGWGYAPTLNDTPYLWSAVRDRVEQLPEDGIVIVGSSRALFDLRLDVLKELTGREPVQLSIVGSSPKPVLQDIIATTDFKGTFIVGVTPVLFFAPGGPPMDKPNDWIAFYHKFSPSQRAGHWLASFLQQRLAFIQQEDLTLNSVLDNMELPQRPNAKLPPRFPPYLNTLEPDRQSALAEMVANDPQRQDVVKGRWQGLFGAVPQAPQGAIDGVIAEYTDIVQEMRRRGGRVIFIRPPSTGWLLEKENELTPRALTWDLLLSRSGAPGIHFEDDPDQRLDCPEWSHLSKADAYRYTRSLRTYFDGIMK